MRAILPDILAQAILHVSLVSALVHISIGVDTQAHAISLPALPVTLIGLTTGMRTIVTLGKEHLTSSME